MWWRGGAFPSLTSNGVRDGCQEGVRYKAAAGRGGVAQGGQWAQRVGKGKPPRPVSPPNTLDRCTLEEVRLMNDLSHPSGRAQKNGGKEATASEELKITQRFMPHLFLLVLIFF